MRAIKQYKYQALTTVVVVECRVPTSGGCVGLLRLLRSYTRRSGGGKQRSGRSQRQYSDTPSCCHLHVRSVMSQTLYLNQTHFHRFWLGICLS